jgi:hypothetical protein
MADRRAAARTPRGLVSECWADDEPVCPLPDWQARGLPRFGDDRWDFRGHPHAIDKAHEPTWVYDWRRAPNPAHELAMREFAMGRMNRPLRLPGVGRFMWPPSTTFLHLRSLEPFLAWVDLQLAGKPLEAVDQDDLDVYAKTVLAGRGGQSHKYNRLRAVQVFFAYFTISATSEHTEDRLELSLVTDLVPWAGKPVTGLIGRERRDQNRTPRIPPAVMDPLLRSALFYVEVAAGDILAAHRELQSYPCDAAYGYGIDDYLDRLDQFLADHPVPTFANGKLAATHLAMASRIPRRHLQTPEARRRLDAARHEQGTEIVEETLAREDLRESLRRFVAARRRAGRGIPIYDLPEGGRAGRKDVGDTNVALCLAMCGLYMPAARHWRQAAPVLEEARAELGGEPGGMGTPISVKPETGQPWRDRFSPASLVVETRMLQTACFLVVTYLSGMRVDEVLALRAGCCHQDITADGLVYVHRLQSTLSKGQPKPVTATWVVTEQVHRAVEVLEQLPRLPTRSTARPDKGTVTVRARRRTDRLFQFGNHLHGAVQSFVTHINELVGHDLLNGRGVNARALRRTLAWYIAHRPFGTTALAIQYKHVHAAISEGYVGFADREFKELLATEAVEAELEALAERLLARQGGAGIVRAGKPSRTSERLDELARGTARFPGLVDPDGHYERRLLRDEHLTYHVGGCANCAFDPACSLCNPGGDHPIMARCRWWECGCAEHLPEHLAAVEHAITEARRHLRLRRLPAPQRQVLRRQVKAMEAKRDAITEANHGP